MFCNRDANEIFLEENSVDLFFMNPPYLGAELKNYGGDHKKYISFADSNDKYIKNMIPLAKHIQHALKNDSSAFIMLRNDSNLGIVKFCNMISENTDLKIGKLFIWNFSNSKKVENPNEEQIAVIIHLYKGKFFAKNTNIKYILDIEFDPAEVEEYKSIGYTNAALPEELYEYFIEKFSNPGDTVADILGGTGTIIRPAVKLGRNFIYNDLSTSQYAIAQTRFKHLIFEYLSS
jgi:DNA modification methylase